MMKTKTIATIGILTFLTFLTFGGLGVADSGPALVDAFKNPPPETRPWCYWYWISNNLSKEGITRDLEAMARVGIGEALIGNVVDPDTPLGDVKLFSDKWWEIVEHAVREGDRVGVRISLFNSPGWSQSGGPWNKPEQAMRYVVSSETRVTGPKEFVGKLPVPKEPFQDIAVIAVPAPKEDKNNIAIRKPTVVCSPTVEGAERLVDGDTEASVAVPAKIAKKGATWTIDIDAAEPFTARSIAVHPTRDNFVVQCRLEAADAQGNFQTIREFPLDRRGPGLEYKVNVGFIVKGPAVVSFDPVTSRKFRLVVSGYQGRGGLTEIDLSSATRLDRYVEKQLGKMHPTPLPNWDSYIWPPSQEPDSSNQTISTDKTVNISDKMSSDGTLRWDVPEGEWIIQRFGMTPTGAHNHPTTVEGQGPEVDKMSRPAIENHFNAMIGKLVERMPKEDRKALHHVVIDSYEVGGQNWTDGFAEDFQQTFGYDPKPWLPVLTGRIVGNADQSDRFLWDMRRLIANRIAYDYVGGLRDVCHRHGLKLWLENYGHWGFPGEFLQYGGQSDDLGGEFWFGNGNLGSIELRAASSAAHLYGKQVVSAEAFTSARSFLEYPASIKSRGDWAYCQGINHFVLHVYIHQPWEDRRPGVNAWFGTEFNRHNTWFEQSKDWIDYLRRCHLMLQQGTSTADVAYFIGEDAPKMTGPLEPALPEGYDYDHINAEVLLSRAYIENGCLKIPDGPSYRILMLSPQETMRPELLRKLRDFVSAGLAVLGPAPQRSPSLQNYPACDDEVRQLAKEIWGDCDGKKSTEHVLGRGRVFCGIGLDEALKRLEVAPDVIVPEGISWTHRQTDDGDIYFISNQQPKARLAEVSFRGCGRAPEIWSAKSGSVENTGWFTCKGNRTRVPLALDPDGSVFVFFRKPVDGVNIVGVKKDGQALAADEPCPIKIIKDKDGQLTVTVDQPGVYTLRKADGKELSIDASTLAAPLAIESQWQLKFPAGSGAPESIDVEELKSWHKSDQDSIRHFAGTATYKTTFDVPSDLIGNGQRLVLDLGRVETIANVSVNGQDLGRVWKKPYALDVTEVVQPGKNTLEIEVTNNWWNRLVADDKLPKEQRKTFTTARLRGAAKKLLPSGLIGPVRIVPGKEYSIKK